MTIGRLDLAALIEKAEDAVSLEILTRLASEEAHDCYRLAQMDHTSEGKRIWREQERGFIELKLTATNKMVEKVDKKSAIEICRAGEARMKAWPAPRPRGDFA